MKKGLFISFLIVLFILALSGCSNQKVSDLKFYIVERSQLTASLSKGEILSLAKKSGRVAFDGDDIDGYNWQTHTVKFKKDSVTSLGSLTEEKGGSAIFKVDDSYAFVLIINDQLVYYGGFEQGSKNPSVPLQPYIQDVDRYSFKILFDEKYSDIPDNRANQDLYSFLNKFGLLSSKSN